MAVRVRRTPPPEFGPALAAARRAAGRRVVDAAREAGITASYWRNLEQGVRCPSVSVAESIADTLSLDHAMRAVILAAAVDDAGRNHPDRAGGARNAPLRTLPRKRQTAS